MLAGFSLKVVYSTMCMKNFQIYGALILGIFTLMFSLFKLAKQREITHSSRQHIFESLFPTKVESGGGNYDLLYQNSDKI